jgi:hypothetical protein
VFAHTESGGVARGAIYRNALTAFLLLRPLYSMRAPQ